MDRTEDEKLTQSPIVVILGEKKYDIKPLVIRDSRRWRKDVASAISALPKYAAVNMTDVEAFGSAIDQLLAVMPDSIIDLFFSYAKDLDREKIEAVATDAEIAAAFEQVVDIAFPLAKSLVGTMTRLSQ